MKTVDRGAAYLDEVAPGWADKIDTETLDLASTCKCVLGQVYLATHPRVKRRHEAYARMLGALGIGYSAASRMGFAAYGSTRYSNLTAAWRRAIWNRRAQS